MDSYGFIFRLFYGFDFWPRNRRRVSYCFLQQHIYIFSHELVCLFSGGEGGVVSFTSSMDTDCCIICLFIHVAKKLTKCQNDISSLLIWIVYSLLHPEWWRFESILFRKVDYAAAFLCAWLKNRTDQRDPTPSLQGRGWEFNTHTRWMRFLGPPS